MARKELAYGILWLFFGGCMANTPVSPPAPPPPNSVAECKAIISDPFQPDDYVVRAIESIRRYPAEEVQPKFWSDIANSGLYTSAHRRWAVLQLFDRYTQAHWTLAEFGALLASPTWLRQDEIVYGSSEIGAGKGAGFPTDLHRGESMLV
jgi:hypothetical protein